nr:uncharacterized protein LOC106687611 [Halyomorpha halys]
MMFFWLCCFFFILAPTSSVPASAVLTSSPQEEIIDKSMVDIGNKSMIILPSLSAEKIKSCPEGYRIAKCSHTLCCRKISTFIDTGDGKNDLIEPLNLQRPPGNTVADHQSLGQFRKTHFRKGKKNLVMCPEGQRMSRCGHTLCCMKK